jgi:hypothetical protein
MGGQPAEFKTARLCAITTALWNALPNAINRFQERWCDAVNGGEATTMLHKSFNFREKRHAVTLSLPAC